MDVFDITRFGFKKITAMNFPKSLLSTHTFLYSVLQVSLPLFRSLSGMITSPFRL